MWEICIIHEAVIRQDAEAIFQAAQALNPSSTMIGALTLSDCAKNLEHMARWDKVTENQVKLAEFDAVSEAAQQAVQEELGKEAV